jgi:trehalose synthase-fused probable maltokinase
MAIPTPGTSAITSYVKERRWFRAKARGLVSATIAETFPLRLDNVDVAFSVILCSYDDGGSERYVLPIATASGEEAARLMRERPHLVIGTSSNDGAVIHYDALGSERLLTALLDRFRDGLTVSSHDEEGEVRHELVFRILPAFEGIKLGNVAPRPMTTEQTNTSIVYGDGFVLKIIRKLEDGPSAELDVGEFLTRHGYASAPLVAGAIEIGFGERSGSGQGVGTEPQPATVGILHRFVPNRGDAWTATLQALEASDAVEAYRTKAALLGRRVGEMHAVLAKGTGPAFVPEPIRKDTRRRLADAVVKEARALTKFLRDGDLPRIVRRLDAFVDQSDDPIAMRIHGDLHLGQILATPEDDFILIDFEGEPARSLAERKVKRSPLADVAGMLRSFHYAAATVLRARNYDASERWYRGVAATFLEAYREATHRRAHPGLTLSSDLWRKTLDFYLFEKCIYEVGYEANNRPDWIAIPQDGIADLLDTEPPT